MVRSKTDFFTKYLRVKMIPYIKSRANTNSSLSTFNGKKDTMYMHVYCSLYDCL